MRNYLCLNQARVNWNTSGNPADPPTGSWWMWGKNVADLADMIARAGTLGVTIVEIEDLGVWYVPLDKQNLPRILNNLVIGRTIQDPFFGVGGYGFQKDPFTDDSRGVIDGKFIPSTNTPRRGWVDSAGVPRAPTPSDAGTGGGFKGAPNQILGWMIEIYNHLVSTGHNYAADRVWSVIRQYQAKIIPLEEAMNRVAAIVNSI